MADDHSLPTGPGRLQLLIVEDDPAVARLLNLALCKTYDLVFAVDGVEAVALLEGDLPLDAVLLDVMLPRLDGSEVYARLAQARPELCARTLVMTGSGLGSPEVRTLQAAGLPFLLKPFMPGELFSALTRLFETNRVPSLAPTTKPGVDAQS